MDSDLSRVHVHQIPNDLLTLKNLLAAYYSLLTGKPAVGTMRLDTRKESFQIVR